MRTEINETMLNSPDFRIEIIPINEDICQVTFVGPIGPLEFTHQLKHIFQD